MSDKEELRCILLDILRMGLLRIRVLGWNGKLEECAAEADRLHNLPDMIREMNIESILYYHNFELPYSMQRMANPGPYEADWRRLGVVLNRMQSRGSKTQGVIRFFGKLLGVRMMLIVVALLLLIGYGIFAK
ncbi:hypothetical protein [Granulicella mallensis]|uniref:Uncharacterized protein n=1 Tax=Granulicella mallensis (strain ATCC BAA-1857 / DSM 23137 / MP5ACTX8) TaxID=682795 RepID=G8NQQ6_GRAMM|nr:hypothetical protein [Granulicella mallensis]AEU37282.1 hypothetical protein AciX8_2979 [Granulicella mallensis MP5ACTX8]